MARICFLIFGLVAIVGSACLIGGCVERELTVKTEPTGGVVFLNDEEIGVAPVTTSFLWYGDYRVRVVKSGYETLITHKKLKRPLDDYPVFDFLAEAVWPFRIRHQYEWNFELEPYKAPSRLDLLNSAMDLRREALRDVNDPNVRRLKNKANDSNTPAKK